MPAPTATRPGFNVDLARLLCDEIKTTCTIQARRFDLLLGALNANQGDAVIASIAPTAEARQRADFTDPYYRTPARFVARADSPIRDVEPELVEGKKIAVVAGTAHEAFLKEMFTEAEVKPYANDEAARAALRNKDVDLLFGDGISLAFWLNGTDSAGCCAFRGGPYLESRFFGEGVGIAVKRGNDSVAAGLELGAVPAMGEGQLYRSVAALFSDQSVLISMRLTAISRVPTTKA